MKLLHEEPREKLHLVLLKNLHFLAKKVSHLWTPESINSLISYIIEQKQNELLVFKASEILYTLAQNSNVYFFFLFNSACSSPLSNFNMQQQNHAEQPVQVDHEKLKYLIENMIFHENKNISFNFCLFAVTVLVIDFKTIKELDKPDESISQNLMQSKYLFDLTKSALFSIILKCNENLNSQSENASEADLKSDINCLKVILSNFEKENFFELLNFEIFMLF